MTEQDFCLYVANDLVDPFTAVDLFYIKASYMSREGL